MKPTITKEQAEAIDSLRNGKAEWDIEEFLYAYTSADYSTSPEFQPIASMDIVTLAAALVNGYEVEKTPEEKVREYFEDVKNRREKRRDAGLFESFRYNDGKVDGIRNTLDYLGIKIEGVNA
ncbi:hypothetical protein [Bacillus halotolerans]|uniref:hypothetical protein n=1 Tax=Bacillus halotolerans TaxID=260554 RepID=UPI00227F035B|nr:hypothetical protein [Bacillus halotolerans]MCY8472388.1 DUF1642 domain-containing protein [Bacillus halotolerans]